MNRVKLLAIVLAVIAGVAIVRPAAALTSAEEVVERARLTVSTMLTDPDYAFMRPFVADAEAVLIFPEYYRGGFLFGGEGGIGLLLVRQENGQWSMPVFYLMAGGSFGLQIGGQVSEIVLTVTTREGVDALLNRQVTLGADIGGAVIAYGGGVEARTGLAMGADMYAFSRNQGLYAGGVVEGSVISEQPDWNEAYYGIGATSAAILDNRLYNPHAEQLRTALPN